MKINSAPLPIPKDVIPLPKNTTYLPPLPDGIAYDDPVIMRIMNVPLPPIENEKINTSNELIQKNYVPKAIVGELSLSLGLEILEKLPLTYNQVLALCSSSVQ